MDCGTSSSHSGPRETIALLFKIFQVKVIYKLLFGIEVESFTVGEKLGSAKNICTPVAFETQCVSQPGDDLKNNIDLQKMFTFVKNK